MAEAKFSYDDGEVHLAAGTAYDSGEIIQLSDGRAAVIQGLKGVLSSEPATAATEGIFDCASASATTFSKGDPVFWDISANLAVPYSSADVPNGDFLLGPAVLAKVDGDLTVKVDLNESVETAAAGQAVVTQTQDALTDNGGGTADGTVQVMSHIALSTSDTYSDAAVNTAVNAFVDAVANNMKEVTTELAKVRVDVAAINTLVTALRLALIKAGTIKGAA